MDGIEVSLLADIVAKNRNLASLSNTETGVWRAIENRFAHALPDGTIVCDVAVFRDGARDKIRSIFKAHPLYGELLPMYQAAFDDTLAILKMNFGPETDGQQNYCASMMLLNTRMMAVNDEVEARRLTVPENPDQSTICMILELK